MPPSLLSERSKQSKTKSVKHFTSKLEYDVFLFSAQRNGVNALEVEESKRNHLNDELGRLSNTIFGSLEEQKEESQNKTIQFNERIHSLEEACE